jgi:5-methylcytosine-specific restriction endonuclease McrA
MHGTISRHHMKRADAMFARMYRFEARAEQNGRCAYCRRGIKLRETTADHTRARSKGGTTQRENISAACSPCNSAKGAMSAKSFKKLIRKPDGAASLAIRLAYIRLRLMLRTDQAERSILAVVGL